MFYNVPFLGIPQKLALISMISIDFYGDLSVELFQFSPFQHPSFALFVAGNATFLGHTESQEPFDLKPAGFDSEFWGM